MRKLRGRKKLNLEMLMHLMYAPNVVTGGIFQNRYPPPSAT